MSIVRLVMVSLCGFCFAVISASQTFADESTCGGTASWHIDPGAYFQMSGPGTGSLDSIWVNQVGQQYFEYWCNCETELEDCYEGDPVPLPPSAGENVWHPAAGGCTWGDTHACTCTQPRSSCCGDLLP